MTARDPTPKTIRRWSSFPSPAPSTPEGVHPPGWLNRLERLPGPSAKEGGSERGGEVKTKLDEGPPTLGAIVTESDADAEHGERLVVEAKSRDGSSGESFVSARAAKAAESTDSIVPHSSAEDDDQAPTPVPASKSAPATPHQAKTRIRPAKTLSVVPPKLIPAPPRPTVQMTRAFTDIRDDQVPHTSNGRMYRPTSRDLPELPPPSFSLPASATGAASRRPSSAVSPEPGRRRRVISTSATETSPPTTPKQSVGSSFTTPPKSQTIYEPVGGDAIELGRSNPLSVGSNAAVRRERSFGGSFEEEEELEGVQAVQVGRAASRAGTGGRDDRVQDIHSTRQPLMSFAPSGSSNLPDLDRSAAQSPTSYPIGPSAIQRDLDHSLRKLISLEVFLEMLKDPLGRHRFRTHLRTVGREAILDMWWDTDVYEQLVKMVNSGALAMHDAYLTRGSEVEVSGIPSKMLLEVMGNLQQTQSIVSPFNKVQNHLLETMFQTDFQVFIRRKLIEHSQVRLGNYHDTSGVGEAFVLTNPRLRDHPIVCVSPKFCEMTGYAKEAIVGRNCRFLQGPGTAPASVQRLRDALNEGEECTELLLNYTRTGVPFWNLLCMIPLRSASGSLVYFIGGQVNVTGSISNTSRLSFLVGGEASSSLAEGSSKLNPLEFSPSLRKQQPSLAMSEEGSVMEHQAAGSLPARGPGAGTIDGSEFGSTVGQELGGGGFDGLQRSSTARGAPSKWNSSSGAGRKIGKLFSRITGQRRADKPDQILMGAENDYSIEVGPLDQQIDYFSNTYNKIAILRPKGHEIVFVTHHLLAYLGLPILSSKAVFSSSLVHMDLTELIEMPDGKDSTRRVRNAIRSAMRNGAALSVSVGLRLLPGSKWSLAGGRGVAAGELAMRKGLVLKLSPCVDRDGTISAYVALFS